MRTRRTWAVYHEGLLHWDQKFCFHGYPILAHGTSSWTMAVKAQASLDELEARLPSLELELQDRFKAELEVAPEVRSTILREGYSNAGPVCN